MALWGKGKITDVCTWSNRSLWINFRSTRVRKCIWLGIQSAGRARSLGKRLAFGGLMLLPCPDFPQAVKPTEGMRSCAMDAACLRPWRTGGIETLAPSNMTSDDPSAAEIWSFPSEPPCATTSWAGEHKKARPPNILLRTAASPHQVNMFL